MPANTALPVCLGPVGTTCIIAGTTITNTSLALLGEMAILGELNSQLTKKDFFPTSYAANLSKYITLKEVKTPDIIYNNSIWSGASYKCLDTSCESAEIYWPIKDTSTSNTSNGYITRQQADGGGSMSSY